jgi:P4 family phage/plasmid primase-like protien
VENTFDEVEFEYTPLELMKILSVRHNLPLDTHTVIVDKQPLYNSLLNKKPAVADPPPTQVPKTDIVPVGVFIPSEHDDDEIQLVKKLALECLSSTRADSYKTWMEVGWCLSNISPTDTMFDIWVEFSNKSTKATETDWNSLRRKWTYSFSKNTIGSKLSMRSLHYWARNDSPALYKEIVDEDHIGYIQYNVDDSHYLVAKALKRIYKDKYCASVERKGTEWYVYDEKIHSWKHTNQGMELRSKLSSDVADLVVRARLRLKKKGWDAHCQQNNITDPNGSHDEDWFNNWAATRDGKHFQILTKVEKRLYANDFKNCVMKEASELFREEDFTNLLNMNPYLIVCKNGVLELNAESAKDKPHVYFRPGKPDDYMSFLAGRRFPDTDAIDYIPYDPNDKDQLELMDFLEKIFPDQSMREYMIRLMSSTLEGTNKEQCYYTFLGVGGNGKSKLVDLMTYAMGDYCSSLQATALTRKRPDSGAANPDIICIKNKRFIYLQEPDDKEPLNTSRMKQFSGEDLVEARGLFEDQQRFRITGKLFMMCNRLPPIHSMDRGTWRRIRVLLFGSKFVDNTDPEYKAKKPNIFLKDESLDKKLRVWREAWFSLMVHVYETQYLVNGLHPIPPIVMQESNKYKEAFDIYGRFKAERVIDFRDSRLGLIEDGSEHVTFKEFWRVFKAWKQANQDTLGGKGLAERDFQNRLDEDFGNLDKGIYKRVAVFDNEEGKEDFTKERMTTDPTMQV